MNTPSSLPQELRVQARLLRTRSSPLNNIIPLIQQAADTIQTLEAKIVDLNNEIYELRLGEDL